MFSGSGGALRSTNINSAMIYPRLSFTTRSRVDVIYHSRKLLGLGPSRLTPRSIQTLSFSIHRHFGEWLISQFPHFILVVTFHIDTVCTKRSRPGNYPVNNWRRFVRTGSRQRWQRTTSPLAMINRCELWPNREHSSGRCREWRSSRFDKFKRNVNKQYKTRRGCRCARQGKGKLFAPIDRLIELREINLFDLPL